MPINNLGNKHFESHQVEDIYASLDSVNQILINMAVNLNASERSKYGKVGEKHKLLINKVWDYHKSQPDLSSPEIDWAEFEKDYNNRQATEGILNKIREMEILLMNIKILNDYDNYNDCLTDYQHAKYKNRLPNAVGFENKINALKVFFPKTGKTRKEKDSDKKKDL